MRADVVYVRPETMEELKKLRDMLRMKLRRQGYDVKVPWDLVIRNLMGLRIEDMEAKRDAMRKEEDEEEVDSTGRTSESSSGS